MNVCKACRSPDRKEIEELLIKGTPFRNIEKRYHVSSAALFRHKRDHLQQVIEKAVEKATETNIINAGEVLGRLRVLGIQKPKNFFTEQGAMKDFNELDDDTAATIGGFEFVNLYEGEGDQKHCFGQLRKIRLINPVQPLTKLGEHLGLFKTAETTPPKVEVLVTTHYIGTPPAADVTVQVIPNLPAPKNGGNGNGHK